MTRKFVSELDMFECDQVTGGADFSDKVFKLTYHNCTKHCLEQDANCDAICKWAVAEKNTAIEFTKTMLQFAKGLCDVLHFFGQK